MSVRHANAAMQLNGLFRHQSARASNQVFRHGNISLAPGLTELANSGDHNRAALLNLDLHIHRAVLKRLGEIGYVGVETAGLHDLTPGEFKQCIDGAGLRVSAAHIQMLTDKNAAQVLDEQDEIGNKELVVAFLPPDFFKDESTTQRVADKLNRAHEIASERGASPSSTSPLSTRPSTADAAPFVA